MSESNSQEPEEPQAASELSRSRPAPDSSGPSAPSSEGRQPPPSEYELLYQRQQFSGPLPPPSVLRGYEEIEPGLADRITTMAEKQSLHRRSLEKSVVEGNLRAQSRGQWFALILGLAGALLAGMLIWQGQVWIGVGLFLIELLSLAGLLLVVEGRGRQELQQKNERETASPDAEQQELPFEE